MVSWVDISRRVCFVMLPLVILLACSFISPAQADTTSDEGKELLKGANADEDLLPGVSGMLDDTQNAAGDAFPALGVWNIVFALGMVLLTFWVIFRFVIRPLMRGAILGRGVEHFRIVATLPIAPTKSIQVVKLVDRLIIIGLMEGGMSQLGEVTDPAEVSEILVALDEKNPVKHHPFKKAFDTLLTRKDEIGFEDKQKKFNTTLDDLKEKIQAMKNSQAGDE